MLFALIIMIGCQTQNKELSDKQELYDYDIEQRIEELGIELNIPDIPPGLNFELATQQENLIYLSGNGPLKANGEIIAGKVGADLTIEQGYEAARLTAINHISILKAKIGDLNRVERVIKVLGMVNADPGFTDHPKVVNGYSDLLVEVFGERGKHARSAVGMASLPWNMACEVEMIVQISE